jgi:hypothetical protein
VQLTNLKVARQGLQALEGLGPLVLVVGVARHEAAAVLAEGDEKMMRLGRDSTCDSERLRSWTPLFSSFPFDSIFS